MVNHAGWLEWGPDRCSRVRFPGGAVLYCWDGGAAQTASSEKADGSPVTKVNHFYNGDYPSKETLLPRSLTVGRLGPFRPPGYVRRSEQPLCEPQN